MDALFNANSGVASSSGTHSAEQDAEQWLSDLASLTEKLSCASMPALDESTLTNAVVSVEKLHRFVLKDTNTDLKMKVASGVGEALKSICDLKPSIERACQDNLPMISKVLDVGDRLLQCHKLIKDQIVRLA